MANVMHCQNDYVVLSVNIKLTAFFKSLQNITLNALYLTIESGSNKIGFI